VFLLLSFCVVFNDGFLLHHKNGTSTKDKATKPPKKGNLKDNSINSFA